jgi:hypothetical protein
MIWLSLSSHTARCPSLFLTENQKQAVTDWQAQFGVVVEPRRHLQEIVFDTRYIIVLDVNITRRFVKVQETNRRHCHPTFGTENKPRFDHPDKLRDIIRRLIFSSLSTVVTGMPRVERISEPCLLPGHFAEPIEIVSQLRPSSKGYLPEIRTETDPGFCPTQIPAHSALA